MSIELFYVWMLLASLGGGWEIENDEGIILIYILAADTITYHQNS
jgi:hypothetical protein